jgi:hypothetical protein
MTKTPAEKLRSLKEKGVINDYWIEAKYYQQDHRVIVDVRLTAYQGKTPSISTGFACGTADAIALTADMALAHALSNAAFYED